MSAAAWKNSALNWPIRLVIRFFRSREAVLSLAMALACAALLWLPTGFEDRLPEGMLNAHGSVVSVDNARVRQFGLVRDGEQRIRVLVEGGFFDNQEIDAVTILTGKLEMDPFFEPGDRAFLNISVADGQIVMARAVDHYRIDLEIGLFALFGILLAAMGFWSGLRALLSFAFTGLTLWRVMVPLFLKGYDPILSGAVATALIMAVIVFLVGGVNKRGLIAFIGSMLGLGAACALAIGLGPFFMLNGAARPFSETLLYSGFAHLDLAKLFLAGIFIASSGAMMDLAMDLSSAMSELAYHRPDLGRWKLFVSGISIGRAVTGTMTTTLLLAYSGGYITMLMLFMGQGIPILNILNMSFVSSEIFHTLVGSIALVATAPLTALVGSFAFSPRGMPEVEDETAPNQPTSAEVPAE